MNKITGPAPLPKPIEDQSMTRYMLHYCQKDSGWIEFETKEQMEEAKQQFEDGESDVSDISNEAHWLYKAVKNYKNTDCSEEYETIEVKA